MKTFLRIAGPREESAHASGRFAHIDTGCRGQQIRPSARHCLQRTLGNRVYGHLVQTKLTLNDPGDRYEQEADRVADRVLRMPEPDVADPVVSPASSAGIQRMCAQCEPEDERLRTRALAAEMTPLIRRQVEEREDEELVQTKAAPGAGSLPVGALARIEAIRGGGRALSPSERSYFEPRFGRDFKGVRIHTDGRAAAAADAVHARAFTLGRDVVFGSGQFAPETTTGKRLLAHELTHVVQQQKAASGSHALSTSTMIESGDDGGREADPSVKRVRHEPGGTTRPSLQRQVQIRERSRAEDIGGVTVLQREEEPEQPSSQRASAPIVSVPGTGLTLMPGPLGPSLLGSRIPLPASLRLTNALGAGPGPTFVLDASPRLLVANILESVDLLTWTRSGTPPDETLDPENQASIALVNPTFTLDPTTGRLRGRGTLSVGSDYPSALKTPTELDVDIESTELGQFTGRLGFGPLHADFNVRIHYDTARLEQALSPVFAPTGGFAGLWTRFQSILRDSVPGIRLSGISQALQSILRSAIAGDLAATEFVTRTIDLLRDAVPPDASLESLRAALNRFENELKHPGGTASGTIGLDIPLLGTLPLTGFSATAPTTVPLARPLPGAPTPLRLSYTAGGVIIAPPGSLTETAVPAFGITHSSFGERSGFSATAAFLPTLSPSAISAGEPLLNQFPVYAYAEVSHVRRLSDDLDLGLRLTVQVSTPELFGPQQEGAGDPVEQFRRTMQDYQQATQAGSTPAPVVPNVGLTLFGRFSGL